MLSTIVVIIPVLDEAETIAGVIASLQAQGLSQICVVDNGSRDRTPEIAAKAGATVVVEPRRGYGQACWRGLQTLMATEAEWILFCDGDGSDDLSQLPELLALRDGHDLILGNRRGTAAGKAQLTPVQNFGNWLATRLIWLGWGTRYEDLGPLRLIRKGALDGLAMGDRGFGWTVEMQAKAAAAGLRTCEMPVNYLPRQGGASKISGTVTGSVKAGRIILTTLAKLYGQKLFGAKLFGPSFEVPSWTVQRWLLWLSALLMMAGSVWAMPHGDFLNDPNAVPLFWRGMGVMSVGFVLAWGVRRITGGWFWVVAIAPRLIFLAMHPGDDIWRYLWEGHIQNHGFNPYLLAPSAQELADLRVDLPLDGWCHINHPDHAGIYPPVTQLVFRVLAWISPSVLLFKSSFVAADLAICHLLSRRFGYGPTLLYAWNPLVIYSFAGGGHYDSWFLLPLVMAWLGWEHYSENAISDGLVEQKSETGLAGTELAGTERDGTVRRKLSAASAWWVGVSISVKWMSLPVLGFLAWQQRRRGWFWSIGLILLGLLPLGLATLPFCQGGSCPVLPLGSDFVTYGRSAALLPPILASFLPSEWLQTNGIYALPLGAVVLWGFWRWRSIGQFTERYLVALMLLSPIIHAWYFTWLMPFAVASRNLGMRLVSLSAFVYFALPHYLATGQGDWSLSTSQRLWLWGPFVLGLVISARGIGKLSKVGNANFLGKVK